MSRSRDVVSKRLSLVSVSWNVGRSRSRSRHLLKIKCLDLVSVSYHRVSFTSQYAQLFASLQNCTYMVLIHKLKRKWLTACTTQNVWRQQSILQHVTLMPNVYQVSHSIDHCVNKKASIRWQDSAPPISGYWPTVSRTQASDAMTSRLPRYEAKCVQRRCFQCGSVPLRSDIKGTERPPANILIPLERQLIALQLTVFI